jgi:hypothetical protein
MDNQRIYLKNIKVQQEIILKEIFQLASNFYNELQQVNLLHQSLITKAAAIETICNKQQLTPANLTEQSRKIYAWIKFLTDEDNLQLHVKNTYYLWETAKHILSTREQKIQLMIAITNLAGLYKGTVSTKAANIMISEGFINAPKAVLQALVESTLIGKSQTNTKIIREFANTEEYSNILIELDLIADVMAENPQGKFYNLDKLFDKINQEYFFSNLAKPRLAWSRINTYRKLGHYESARDRVVISLALDDAKVPEFVVEFVLYHELLHKYHGTKWVQGRRMVHTKEFRASESQFKFYNEASRWLQKSISK